MTVTCLRVLLRVSTRLRQLKLGTVVHQKLSQSRKATKELKVELVLNRPPGQLKIVVVPNVNYATPAISYSLDPQGIMLAVS